MEIITLITDFENKSILYNQSPLTTGGYEDQLKNYLNHFSRNPKTISVNEAIEYLIGLNVHSRKTAIAALKFFYSKCLNSTKFNKLEYPKIPEYIPDVLNESEVNDLINVADNIKHKTIIMLLYSTGMRVTELINLKWNKIDKATMTIHIVQGKGKKDRAVKLAPTMKAQLIAYCKAYGIGCFNSNDYVFKGQRKPKYSRRSVEAFMERYGKKAGIKKRVSPHILRHCTGTHLRARGIDLADIQDILGHKSPKTTRIYSKLTNLKRIPDLLA